MAWGRMPLGENPPGSAPSMVNVPSLPSESTITIAAVAAETEDIVDSAPVTDLTKNTVHARVVADDDVVIDAGDTRASHVAYSNVIAVAKVTLERLITEGCISASGGVGSERVPTDSRVGAAGGIVHERKVTSGSVGASGVVKDKRVGSKGGVLCAGGVEQKRCHTHRRVGICVVEGQRAAANTGVKAAGGIYK